MATIEATPEDVRYAYRLLLGREPDRDGFSHFVDHIRRSRSTTIDVADGIMRSDEFRIRAHGQVGLGEARVHGVKIFPWHGDRLIGDHIVANGEYEPHVLPAFLEAIKPGDFVLDVGANIGVYSLLAASRVGVSGRVFSIEPIARNVNSLCAGIHANGFDNVSVIPVAASDRTSVIGVLRHVDSSNGIVDKSVNGTVMAEYVPTQRLDELLAAVDRLDVIKIDIEGHEPLAWRGIEPLVRRFTPMVFTEFNPLAIRNHARVAPETYLDMLFDCAGEIAILQFDRRRRMCRTSAEVMSEWRRVNDKSGVDGTIHLDLLLRTRS